MELRVTMKKFDGSKAEASYTTFYLSKRVCYIKYFINIYLFIYRINIAIISTVCPWIQWDSGRPLQSWSYVQRFQRLFVLHQRSRHGFTNFFLVLCSELISSFDSRMAIQCRIASRRQEELGGTEIAAPMSMDSTITLLRVLPTLLELVSTGFHSPMPMESMF